MKVNLSKENSIIALLVLVIILIIVSSALIYYNKNVAEKGYDDLEVASKVVYELSSNHLSVIRMADISIRGYALVRDERFLFITPDSLELLMQNTFYSLDSALKVQGYSNYSGLQAIKEYEEYIRELVVDYKKMAGYLKNGQDSLFIDLFKQDKGSHLGPLINAAESKVIGFQKQVINEAKNTIQVASLGNLLSQSFLLLIGIPTLIFLIVKLKSDSKNRITLLHQLQLNNKKFLFDRGEKVERVDASQIISESIENLEKASLVVNKIALEDFEVEWDGMNDNNRDKNDTNLSGRLIQLKENLKRIKKEDSIRFWLNDGLNQFSSLVRNNQADLEGLCHDSLKFLTKYLKAQQGSLFVKNEEKGGQFRLDLIASYAFDRKKYVSKSIETGEGLVGQTLLEKETVVMTEIPQGYLQITSGLGDAQPNGLVIVPFKNNEEVEAILELASFKAFEPHEIEFLERAGAFVASALISLKSAIKMKDLLMIANQQKEEMRAAEEELRQNMEEMQATQDESERKALELQNVTLEMKYVLESMDTIVATIEFTPEGIVTTANSIFLKTMGYTLPEIVGQHHQIFLQDSERNSLAYQDFWVSLANRKASNGKIVRVAKNGKLLNFNAIYSPSVNAEGNVVKVTKYANLIS